MSESYRARRLSESYRARRLSESYRARRAEMKLCMAASWCKASVQIKRCCKMSAK